MAAMIILRDFSLLSFTNNVSQNLELQTNYTMLISYSSSTDTLFISHGASVIILRDSSLLSLTNNVSQNLELQTRYTMLISILMVCIAYSSSTDTLYISHDGCYDYIERFQPSIADQ